ncbi:MAG: DUF1007 family protein [Rhodobacteraceae bacterium]|nr:DUF1007 family protein [Paracoccaceae bacterium]
MSGIGHTTVPHRARLRRVCRRAVCLWAGLSWLVASGAQAHPHVFVDGGVDLRMTPSRQIKALEVTWLYDGFETLYMLASHEIGLNARGGLDEADRRLLVERLSSWPEDFDGSAHLRIDGLKTKLDWPTALDVHLIDGRLQLTFTRSLPEPVDPSGKHIEIAFFESTYFFDFTVTNAPRILGPSEGCAVDMVPFDAESGDTDLLNMLAKLGREETSGIRNVGESFADRIFVQCE